MPSPDLSGAATAVLAACRRGEPWPREAFDLLVESGSPALFSDVVEPLSDSYEAADCDAYAKLFSAVLERVTDKSLTAKVILERYESVRQVRRYSGPEPEAVCVLSRVTLGADIAIASVMLDAAKRRFPSARIMLAGPAKNYELFDADERVEHLPAPYGRSAHLSDRIQAGLALRAVLPADALVVDPDSRLSQLGLLPMSNDPQLHLLFEGRRYGGASETASLTSLASKWVEAVLGVAGARNFLRTRAAAPRRDPGMVAVSLGVGGNPAKLFPDPFESRLMRALADTGRPVLVDLGAGGEEEERVQRAIVGAGSPGHIATWRGSFASFASAVGASSLYVGYDSSGQHAAAALGVPRLTLFAGYPNERFLARWQPEGPGAARSLCVTAPDPAARLRHEIEALLSFPTPSDRTASHAI